MKNDSFSVTALPITVLWRALDLYGTARETTIETCLVALQSAAGRIDVTAEFPGITPLAQALAEYMSLSGPFAEVESAEFCGINGYGIG